MAVLMLVTLIAPMPKAAAAPSFASAFVAPPMKPVMFLPNFFQLFSPAFRAFFERSSPVMTILTSRSATFSQTPSL